MKLSSVNYFHVTRSRRSYFQVLFESWNGLGVSWTQNELREKNHLCEVELITWLTQWHKTLPWMQAIVEEGMHVIFPGCHCLCIGWDGLSYSGGVKLCTLTSLVSVFLFLNMCYRDVHFRYAKPSMQTLTWEELVQKEISELQLVSLYQSVGAENKELHL